MAGDCWAAKLSQQASTCIKGMKQKQKKKKRGLRSVRGEILNFLCSYWAYSESGLILEQSIHF